MPRDREFELKFFLEPGAAERLVAHPALGGTVPCRPSRLVSTYFDTDEQALRHRRVTLRVRKAEAGTVHTLKRTTGSMIDRDEWEREDDGAQPDLAWLRSTPLRTLFQDREVVEGLGARFSVDVARTVLPIAFEDTTIEGALDEGAIRAGGLSLPVHEFELECKDGPSDGVIRLARRLVRDLPLTLSLASKAERGFGVADLSWGRPSKAIPVELGDAKSLGQLVTVLVQACLDALCRNAALIGGGEDPQAVHAARIALRHLRALFKLFEPVLRRKRLARLEPEVKWMSDKLGAARDADVFRALAAADAGTAALGAALEARHRRAHARLESTLASARWRLLLLDLLAFSTDGVRRSLRERRAAPLARARLRRGRADVARRTRGLHQLSPEERHDARKRAKMLRYDLELLADLPKLRVGAKRLRRVGKHLHVLQQTLGEVQDATALERQVRAGILDRRTAPAGLSADDWRRAREAAQRLVSEGADTQASIREAAKAAKRLRAASL